MLRYFCEEDSSLPCDQGMPPLVVTQPHPRSYWMIQVLFLQEYVTLIVVSDCAPYAFRSVLTSLSRTYVVA